jgi:hypothetical protein
MNGAPLPDFTAIVRATAYEKLPELSAALSEASARTIARIAEEAVARSARGRKDVTPTKWVSTVVAARVSGELEEGEKDKKTIRRARQLIASWARNQPWAARGSRRRLMIDLDGFRRYLDLKRVS